MNKLLSFFNKVLFLLGLGFVFNIISWLIIVTQIKPTSEVLPLHYNIFYGLDQVGKGYYIYGIPLVGLVILILNYILYRYAVNKEPFAAKTLIAVGLVAQVFILFAILFLKSIIV